LAAPVTTLSAAIQQQQQQQQQQQGNVGSKKPNNEVRHPLLSAMIMFVAILTS
jgi:hypothetical protein